MPNEIIEVEVRPRRISLRDLYYIFFRHKWKLILVFLGVVAIVAVRTFCADNIYRSEAKLLVRIGRESVTLDPTATTGPVISVGRSLENEVNTELEILKSRQIAENVVDSLGPEAFQNGLTEATPNLLERLGVSVPLSSRDRAILSVIEDLEVKAEGGVRGSSSNIIDVSYEATDPKLAQQVLTKLIDSYMEKHIAVHRTPGSYQFFTQQVGQLLRKLEQSEKELESLKSQTRIYSLVEQRGVILDRIGTLQTEIDSAEAALAASRAKTQALQAALDKTPELVVTGASTGPNAAVDTMRGRLYELQLLGQDLVSKFEPDSRQVQDVRKQIAAAQALLDREEKERTTVTKGSNAAYGAVQSALLTEQPTVSSLQAQIETLKKNLLDAEAELKFLSDSEYKITVLTREVGIQEANYRKYSENLEQARIDSALENGKISNINVVQPATLPMMPVRPQKTRNMLLGIIGGIFGGIVLAFFVEYLDHSIKTPDEVQEKLLLPTLACIPKVRRSRISSAEKWEIPASIREHYEAFKEQLLLGGQKDSEKELRVLAIAGSHDNEGASTVAANLAAALARHGDGQVLLIDADLRHPSVHQIFESRLSPGLTDVIANGHSIEDVIVPSPVKNLNILSTGTIDENLSEIFDSNAFTDLFNSIKKDYRFVVIDLPAVNEASWAVRLARLSDGVGLVVEAERSRWEVVQRTKELLAQSNANVLGVVINKRRFYIPRWLYRTL